MENSNVSKLNLWCWFDIKPGYVNVDGVSWEWIDEVFDFEKTQYPFKDNTFDEVYCSMVMEHIHNLPQMIDEIVRICKNGAIIQIIVPYQSSPNLRWDITHIRGFNLNSFNHYHENSIILKNGKFNVERQRIHFLSNETFLKSDAINLIPDFFINLFPKIYERFFSYIIPSSNIHYELKVYK